MSGTPPSHEASPASPRSIAITGAAGYIGSRVLDRLLRDRGSVETIVAIDVRPVSEASRQAGVVYVAADIRVPHLDEVFREHRVDAVVHLAAVVTPGPEIDDGELHSVEVQGTENVLEACLASGVPQIVIVSDTAAYGYHPDNPTPIPESAPLRGNDEFAESRHKRMVEELLARWRQLHPELRQLVLRCAHVLGPHAHGHGTERLTRKWLAGVKGVEERFAFAWDEDLATLIVRGLHERRAGIYNVAGDGVVTAREIAERTGARLLSLSPALLRRVIGMAWTLGLTKDGPEQLWRVRYRPVPSTDALRRDFGAVPRLTAHEAFERFWSARRRSA